jgi:hypothetical protein
MTVACVRHILCYFLLSPTPHFESLLEIAMTVETSRCGGAYHTPLGKPKATIRGNCRLRKGGLLLFTGAKLMPLSCEFMQSATEGLRTRSDKADGTSGKARLVCFHFLSPIVHPNSSPASHQILHKANTRTHWKTLIVEERLQLCDRRLPTHHPAPMT